MACEVKTGFCVLIFVVYTAFSQVSATKCHIQIHVPAHSIAVNKTTSVVVIASMSLAGIQAIARQVSIAVMANVL